jgi:hypothetical protein
MLTFRFEFNRFQHRFDKKRAWDICFFSLFREGVWRYLLIDGLTNRVSRFSCAFINSKMSVLVGLAGGKRVERCLIIPNFLIL